MCIMWEQKIIRRKLESRVNLGVLDMTYFANRWPRLVSVQVNNNQKLKQNINIIFAVKILKFFSKLHCVWSYRDNISGSSTARTSRGRPLGQREVCGPPGLLFIDGPPYLEVHWRPAFDHFFFGLEMIEHNGLDTWEIVMVEILSF